MQNLNAVNLRGKEGQQKTLSAQEADPNGPPEIVFYQKESEIAEYTTKAIELFSSFTASIIREETLFIR